MSIAARSIVQTSAPFRPISLIVAADDELLRRRLRKILDGLGADIREAQTAWDAMSLLLATRVRVDLLIGDWHLLSTAGLEALAYVRSAGISVPFLLLTSAGRPSHRLEASQLGATFAEKPVVARDLVTRVRKICRLGVDDGPGAAA